jgi:hypothetical protein
MDMIRRYSDYGEFCAAGFRLKTRERESLASGSGLCIADQARFVDILVSGIQRGELFRHRSRHALRS